MHRAALCVERTHTAGYNLNEYFSRECGGFRIFSTKFFRLAGYLKFSSTNANKKDWKIKITSVYSLSAQNYFKTKFKHKIVRWKSFYDEKLRRLV